MRQGGCRGKVKRLWCSGRAQDEEEARGEECCWNGGVSGIKICSQNSIPNALLEFCAVPVCSVSLFSLLPPDCHPLCQQCVANLRDTGSVCLKCQNSRHLLLGDLCLPHCPPGHYAHSGACKSECFPHTAPALPGAACILGTASMKCSCSAEKLCPAGRMLHLSRFFSCWWGFLRMFCGFVTEAYLATIMAQKVMACSSS